MGVQAVGAIAQSLLPEFDMEIDATRKVLERVPNKKLGWKPHDKSMTLQRLASHVAEVPQWGVNALTLDELDIAPIDGPQYQPPSYDSSATMVAEFDKMAAEMRRAIENAADDEFMKPWTLKRAGETLMTVPKIGVLRRFVMNHLIHHRGQLTVYLRLNDVPVPQTLGPTADEPNM